MTTYTARKMIKIKNAKGQLVSILPGQPVELTGDDEKQALRKKAVFETRADAAAAKAAATAPGAVTEPTPGATGTAPLPTERELGATGGTGATGAAKAKGKTDDFV